MVCLSNTNFEILNFNNIVKTFYLMNIQLAGVLHPHRCEERIKVLTICTYMGEVWSVALI